MPSDFNARASSDVDLLASDELRTGRSPSTRRGSSAVTARRGSSAATPATSQSSFWERCFRQGGACADEVPLVDFHWALMKSIGHEYGPITVDVLQEFLREVTPESIADSGNTIVRFELPTDDLLAELHTRRPSAYGQGMVGQQLAAGWFASAIFVLNKEGANSFEV